MQPVVHSLHAADLVFCDDGTKHVCLSSVMVVLGFHTFWHRECCVGVSWCGLTVAVLASGLM